MLFSGSILCRARKRMSVIFSSFQKSRRHFLLSAISYVYIFLIGLGILLVSFMAGAIEPMTPGR